VPKPPLERLDPTLDEAELLASSVVLGILLEIAVLAGRGDSPDRSRPADGTQLVQLGLEALVAVGRQLDDRRLAGSGLGR
jgi:hypothetical protein